MIVVPFLVVVILVYLFLVFPCKPKKDDYLRFAKRSYAHRGLHDNEHGPSENSLESFIKASQQHYGIELDVQLTADKEVIVFHDPNLTRTSNVDIEVAKIDYEQIKHIKVFDREYIPLLSEALNSVSNETPLIIEIKSVGSREWVNEICRLTYEQLKNYTGIYCVESFDPFAIRWFAKNAPSVLRGQLSMSGKKYQGSVKPFTAFLLQSLLLNFLGRPHFIAYEHEDRSISLAISKILGAMIVRWTVKSQQKHDELQMKSEGIIFEGYTPITRW